MSSSFAIFLVVSATVAGIQGYCDFKSRSVQTQLSKGLIQANRWLIEAQEEDGKWIDLHTTGNALAVLKMIGYDMNENKTCSKTFEKAAIYFTENKYDIKQAIGGKLAYIIMGLNALCKDPSNYNSMNLTKHLLEDVINFPKGEFNHYFQYSLALTTLGINDVQVPWHTVGRLINKIKHILKTKERHSKDTCALFVMALQSVAGQFKDIPVYFKEINKFVKKLSNALSMKTSVVKDNLWTKSLVMQAHSAIGKALPWNLPRCESLYDSLLSKKGKDGSFGGLSAALHVLPALAGVSFLDLNKDSQCYKEEMDNETKPMINVCVKIEFEAISKEDPEPQMVQVVQGSTALDALKAASQLHGCYQFDAKTTAWGAYITKICRIAKNDAKKIYWMFYIDDEAANVGVSGHIVKEDQCVTMKYKKYEK